MSFTVLYAFPMTALPDNYREEYEMGRPYGNFKYKLIKKLYNRATTFRDEADTPEKREAWNEVTTWLESFYEPGKRCLSKTGVICTTIRDREVDSIPMPPMEIVERIR